MLSCAIGSLATGQLSADAATEHDLRQDVAEHESTARPTLGEIKTIGAQLSSYRGHPPRSLGLVDPQADVAASFSG